MNTDCAEILRQHNAWRRSDELTEAPFSAEVVGQAIDEAVLELLLLRRFKAEQGAG